MRIGINARLLLLNRMEGIGWHAFEIINRITHAHPEHEFVLYYDRHRDILIPSGKNIRPVFLLPQSRHPLLMWWWCNSLSRAINKDHVDVFYSPEVLMPTRGKIPMLITIHDLSPIVLPESIPGLYAYYFQHLLPLNAGKADHILTVSQFSKSALEQHLKIPSEKISVVYNAARDIFRPLSIEKKQGVRGQFTNGNPYFIYLGSIHDRKNVDKIIQAFDLFIQKYRTNHLLLLAGNFMGRHHKAKLAIHQSVFASRIIQLGYREDPVIASLLAAADAMINLSQYEGFGMPLVEAFQAGTPVIAAAASSYPEIVGQAGILVDPEDLSAVAAAMHQSIFTPDQFSKQGLIRATAFDWETSAGKVWESIVLLVNK